MTTKIEYVSLCCNSYVENAKEQDVSFKKSKVYYCGWCKRRCQVLPKKHLPYEGKLPKDWGVKK